MRDDESINQYLIFYYLNYITLLYYVYKYYDLIQFSFIIIITSIKEIDKLLPYPPKVDFTTGLPLFWILSLSYLSLTNVITAAGCLESFIPFFNEIAMTTTLYYVNYCIIYTHNISILYASFHYQELMWLRIEKSLRKLLEGLLKNMLRGGFWGVLRGMLRGV